MARPRKHNRAELKEKLEKYIKDTKIPIVAEFAYKNNIPRQYLYDLDELTDTIKKLIDKKEAQLETLALNKDVNHSMAIFSLKQLGWKDTQEIETTNKSEIEVVIK